MLWSSRRIAALGASAALLFSVLGCASPAGGGGTAASKPSGATTGAPSGDAATAAGAPAGGAAASNASSGSAGTVKIFSSLPMTGSAVGQTQTIVNGIRMAVEEHGGKAGSLTVSYEALDDATPAKGSWD